MAKYPVTVKALKSDQNGVGISVHFLMLFILLLLLFILPYGSLFSIFRKVITLKNLLSVFLKLQFPFLLAIFIFIIFGILSENIYYKNGVRVGYEIHYLGFMLGIILCSLLYLKTEDEKKT